MIQLEHINLVVPDIKQMLDFYQAVFPHWAIREEGQGTWYGKPRQWVHFGDEYNYIALSDHGEGLNRDLTGAQTGLAHFAYRTNNIAAIVERLAQAGYSIAKDGNEDLYRRNVYFVDPAGFEIEFVQYLSDEPIQRNLSS